MQPVLRSKIWWVASFVRLNQSLSDSTVLGNQLSEYLIAELQDFGLAVVDLSLQVDYRNASRRFRTYSRWYCTR